jgi:parallel beta-helix repeat protein
MAAVFAVVPVNVSAYVGDVRIYGDGTVSPSDGPISKNGNVYTLTDDIIGLVFIYNSEMVFDGDGHSIAGGIYIEDYPHSEGPIHDVTIRNCGMIGGPYGIYLNLGISWNIIIESNTIYGGWSSIRASEVDTLSNLQVIDNTILRGHISVTGAGGGYGIVWENRISGSSILVGGPGGSFDITENILTGSGSGTGIICHTDSTINYNWISNYENGISVKKGTNEVTKNVILGSGIGAGIICENDNNIISDNKISNNEMGIYLKGSNPISDNEIFNNEVGISLEGSSGSHIINNEIHDNSIGIGLYPDSLGSLQGSDGNQISDNLILDNSVVGIEVSGSSDNQIWHNDFARNAEQAHVSGGTNNVFNLPLPTGGNYWSDYDEAHELAFDVDNDGFVDDPYTFEGGTDYFPLINSFEWTPVGVDIQVNPHPDVSVTFSEITDPGLTTVTTRSYISYNDVNYLQFGDTYYDITTTATFSGDIMVCISYDDTGMTLDLEMALQILHWEDLDGDGIFNHVDVTCPDYPDIDDNIICGCVPSLSWFSIAYPVTPVEIDIKPGSDPNSINLGAKGNVPVGILTTSDFDATTVDPGTVTLAGASVGLRGKSDKLMASIEDVNGDDVDDLLVHIDIEELALIEGSTIAALHGTTFDGEEVKGIDSINIVPP